MDADGTPADGFEFNLTRVLEMLDERAASANERIDQPGRRAAEFVRGLDRARAAMDAPPESMPPPVPDAPEPTLAPLPHRVPGSSSPRPPADTAPLLPPAPSSLPTRTPTAPPADSQADIDPPARPDGIAVANQRVGGGDLGAAAADPLPVLPPQVPKAPAAPEAADAQPRVKMPTVADVRQFQRAQYRQARRSRKGKLAGRVMLTFMVVAGAVAAALTVGRTYLFPADWSDELVPVVDEIEAARGVEFDDVVDVVEQPPAAYGASVSQAVFGPDPTTRVAVWRALGVATGEVDAAAVAGALVDVHPAVFDPAQERIVVLEGRSVDVRALLHRALDAQLAPAGGGDVASPPIDVLGPLPVTVDTPTPEPGIEASGEQPTTVIATAEGVVASVNARSDEVVSGDAPGADTVDPTTLTDALPVAYQVAAGPQLLAELSAGSVDGGLAALGDGLLRAPDATLDAGDVPLSGPVGLGIDDWTLVWANRLPADAVDTLVAGTTADSIRTFRRGEALCVGAVFGMDNEMYAAAAVTHLGTWAAAAPVEARATVTQLAPTFVQLTACDPGAAVPQVLTRAAVDVVIARQTGRLAEAGTVVAPTTP